MEHPGEIRWSKIYTARDFTDYIICCAKKKMKSDYNIDGFNQMKLKEQFNEALHILGWVDFNYAINDFIHEVERK